MDKSLKSVGLLFKDAFSQWSRDHASRLAAALAYYALFSLAPLLIVVIVIAGQVVGQASVKAEIMTQIQNSLGPGTANLVQTMIVSTSRPGSGIVATIISVVTILLGAMGVFGQLHEALNTIWGIQPKAGRGIVGIVKDRAIAFAALLGIGFLILLLFLLSASLAVVQKFLGDLLPGVPWLWQGLNLLVSFAVLTVLVAMMYKVLPDASVAWRDIWVGALATAALMGLGNVLIGLYLGRSSTASLYGAAGSLVVILLYIYYSAQIFLFGAELTQVYSARFGSRIRLAGEAALTFPEVQQEEKPAPQSGGKAEAAVQARSDGRPTEDTTPRRSRDTSSSLVVLLLIAASVAAIVAGIVRGSKGR
jgi:membrane protein